MAATRPNSGFLHRAIREPLLHFLLIGVALFGIYYIVTPSVEKADTEVIDVSPQTAAQLAERFQAVWGQPPTEADLDRLIDSYIREEILVREAIRLSMDRNDAVIRKRLAQKMSFLMESIAGAVAPDEGELVGYFEENIATYTNPAQIGFDQVFLGSRPSSDEVSAALAALGNGAAPEMSGQASILPRNIDLASRQVIDATFGEGFFARIEDLEPGRWDGPVKSGYGHHLVRIKETRVPTPPSFESVRDIVEKDWRRARAEETIEHKFVELMNSYDVSRPDIAAIREVVQ